MTEEVFDVFYWVIYDISAEKGRRHAARLCQDQGLRRVQKSVFAGEMSQEQILDFRENVLSWIEPESDSMLMVPVTRKQMGSIVSLGAECGLTDMMQRRDIVYI